MKTPSSQLFFLIKKMSAAEKRFLKIHFSSVKSHLTELFDFINTQEYYDEKIVKANFSNSLISKNLKVYKVQLTELILRSQVAYHAKRSVRSHIRILLEEVDILLEQFMVSVALVRLNKAIEICKKNNETGLLVIALQYRFKIQNYICEHKEKKTIKSDSQELVQALKTLTLETELIQLDQRLENASVYKLNKEKSIVLTALQKIPNRDEIREGNNLNTFFFAKLEALTTPSINDRIVLQEKILEKFQTGKYVFVNRKYVHLVFLSDLLDSYVLTTNKTKVEEMINLIKKVYTGKNYHKRFLYQPAYIEAKHNFYHGIQEHKLSSFENISGINSEIKIEVENVFVLGFHFFEILSSMASGKSENTKSLLSVLQSATKPAHIHENVLLDLIEIIDHYDCDNTRTVNYLISSFQRKLKRGKTFTPFTIAAYEFVKDILKHPEEKKSFTKQFIYDASIIENDAVLKLWKQFYLDDWLDCLLHDIKFSELDSFKTKMKRTEFYRQLSVDITV